MANVVTGGILNPQDIVKDFYTSVRTVALSGAYSIVNIPRNGQFQCVPSSILGNPNTDVPDIAPGYSEGPISASLIYNQCVKVTKILLRCGTFSHTSRRSWSKWGTAGSGSGYDNVRTKSGKCFFTEAYSINANSYSSGSVHCPSITNIENAGVSIDMPFSAKSINDLLVNCLSAWNSTGKPQYSKTDTYCHSSCHSNCHSSCHGNCDCYNCYGTPGAVCYSNSHGDGTYTNSTCQCYAACACDS